MKMDNLTPKKHNTQSTTPLKSTPVTSMSTPKTTPPSPHHVDNKLSAESSTTDSKTPKVKSTCDLKTTRRFLSCIGKHLGCSFLQQNPRHLPQKQLHSYVYNSQDDLPSSSTDSFSLSYERGSRIGFHLTGSNIDLSYSGADNLVQESKNQKQRNHHQQQSQHASRYTLSSSAYSGLSYSPAFCPFDVDCLGDAYNGDGDDEADVCSSFKMYRQHHSSDVNVAHSFSSGQNSDTNSSDEDDENSNHNERCEQQQKRKCTREHHQQHHGQQKQSSSHRRLHLSRMSIASSVTRMLSHFISSPSMRSLSCSSTPLRCFKDVKPKETDDVVNLNDKNKKHSLPEMLSSSSSRSSGNSSSGDGNASASSNSSSSSKNNNNRNGSSSSKKKEKKQQSILRPPVHYVYMKGMSGLYSRVPRYTVCSPYAMH
ncbi:dual specificity protein kinase splB [Anastrepha obliqua]|uniref:dual specificity protein kinase splB n=1 Tax=Anastrepha obliqua TaxID=95512 RepID=UPI00240A9A7F|nr:dual specificity protein kinase splB [Anastrepha obliqua]